MKRAMLVIVGLAISVGEGMAQTSVTQHPDPRSGLPRAVGTCHEKNLNGVLVAKAKTQKACASHSIQSVWVEGNKIVSYGRSAPPNVATGAKPATPQKAPL